jgi:hypothetical protein
MTEWAGPGHPARLCYNSFAMMNTFLVPEKTVVQAKGDGPAVEVSGAASRVFLLTLNIRDVVEQESLDVGIFGSADGSAWAAKPLETFPQKFYRGQHPMLLDLTQRPDIGFLRAHWEVNRWGRGDGVPKFEFSVSIQEVPPDVLQEATAEAKSLA